MEMPRVLYLARYLRTYTQGAGEHRHDFYQIFLPASPEIRLLSGGKVFIPGEDEVVLVSPARMHVLCVLENIPQPTKFSYNVALDCKFELSDPALVKQLKKLPMLCRVRNMETLRKLADGMIDALLRNASEETLSVMLQTLLTLVIKVRKRQRCKKLTCTMSRRARSWSEAWISRRSRGTSTRTTQKSSRWRDCPATHA